MKKIAVVLCCMVSCTAFATKGKKNLMSRDITVEKMRDLKELVQNQPKGYEQSAYSQNFGDERTTTQKEADTDVSELHVTGFVEQQETEVSDQ